VASLYIEFEDSEYDDVEFLDAGPAEFGAGAFGSGAPADAPRADDPEIAALGIEGPHEVIGVSPRSDPPRWRRPRLPEQRRRILIGAVVVAGIGAGIGDALAAQAAQHAADRPTLDLVDAAYTPNADGDGYDLLLDLGNGGASTATITSVAVNQPGLALLYPGAAAAVGAHQQIEIVLGGQFDCSGLTGDPATIQITLRTAHGTAADLSFPVPASAALPDGWLSYRAAYCDFAETGGLQ
jgi:hypothetical protein